MKKYLVAYVLMYRDTVKSGVYYEPTELTVEHWKRKIEEVDKLPVKHILSWQEL